jgi:hypothetical protein
MPYASYCCAVEAPFSKVWSSLTSQIRKSPRSSASHVRLEVKAEGPDQIQLDLQGLHLTEECITETEATRLILRLAQGQVLKGERQFHVKREDGRVLLGSTMDWDSGSGCPLGARDILPYMDLLVRSLLLEVKQIAEASSAK